MSRVKGAGNKATELRLITIFRTSGITGWRRRSRAFGKPDFVFPKEKVAVFVDGCFWHGCPHHGSIPMANRDFWQQKLRRNRQRDLLVNRTLKKQGWTLVRLWQHELRAPECVVRRVARVLRSRD
ncbi:very short patch repair endonuclease [Bradyrhizobium sp. SZCCHNR31031]